MPQQRATPAAPAKDSNGTGNGHNKAAAPSAPPRSWNENVHDGVPEGLWMRCPECEAMLFRKNVEQNNHVCPECDHHYRIGATERAQQLCDPGSFEPLWENYASPDPLGFKDLKVYKDRLKAEQTKTGQKDAVVTGRGFIKGRGVVLACMAKPCQVRI